MLIDSHCHLDYFSDSDLPLMLARAAEAGIGEMVTIGTTLAQSQTLPAMAMRQSAPMAMRAAASLVTMPPEL